MKNKKDLLALLFFGGSLVLTLGLIIQGSKKQNAKKHQALKEDPFDTTELSSSYHYMHSEIKK